jgi:hypothetical protein
MSANRVRHCSRRRPFQRVRVQKGISDMKKFIRALTIAATALFTVAVLASPAQAVSTLETQAAEPTARIVNFNSSMCMAIPGGSLAAGERVIQWPCTNAPDHLWRFQSLGGNWYRIVNNRSGLCLAVPGGSVVPGAGLIQWPCGNYNANYWYVEANSSGLYRIYNASAIQCAAVPGGSLSAGTGVIQWPCGTSRDHYWYIAFV